MAAKGSFVGEIAKGPAERVDIGSRRTQRRSDPQSAFGRRREGATERRPRGSVREY